MGLFFVELSPTGIIVIGILVLGIFFVGYLGARSVGSWSNEISDQEYVERVQEINSPEYGHPGR